MTGAVTEPGSLGTTASDQPTVRRSTHAKYLGIIILLALVWFFPLFQGKSYSAVPGYRTAVFPWAATDNGKTFFPQSDQAALTFPLQAELSQSVRDGTVPLWNAESFGGQPIFSDGSSAFGYPPKLLLAKTVSPTTAHNLLSVLHVALAGIFTYWLLIDLEVSPLAALFGAIAWMFGSFTLAWLQLEVVAPLFAWFPASLVTMRKAVTRTWLWVPAASACLALLFLSTHLLFADVCMVAVCAYGGFLALSSLIKRWRIGDGLRSIAAGARGVVAGLLGIGLAGVVLVPTAYALKDISRQPLTFQEITKIFILSPVDLKYSLLPPALPISDPKMEWGMAFVGTCTAVLAVVGLFLRRRGAGLGRGLVIGALLVAFGGPVSWLAFRIIPGMNVFRPYSRLLFVFDMGVAVLGAVGLDAAMRAVAGGQDPVRPRPGRHSRTTRVRHSRRWWVSRVLAVMIIAFTALQLGVYGRHINPPFLPSTQRLSLSATPLTKALASGTGAGGWPDQVLPANDSSSGWQPPMLDSNVALVFGLHSASGYDSSVPTRTVSVWRVVGGESPDEVIDNKLPGAFQPTFDAAKVRYDLLPRLGVNQVALTPAAAAVPSVVAQLTSLGWRRGYSGSDGTVYTWTGPKTGPVVVFGTTTAANDRAALDELSSPAFDYRTDAILLSGEAPVTQSGGSGTVVSARQGVNTAAITTHASAPGLLVIPEMWDRGWTATVNGLPSPVLRANFNQQAVAVPAGDAVVKLTFRPTGYLKGMVLTGLSLAVCVGIVLGCLVRRRRSLTTRSTAEVGAPGPPENHGGDVEPTRTLVHLSSPSPG